MAGVRVGARLPERHVAVEAGPMKVFSLLTADPNPIHWDVSAVRALGLGERPVNQGGLNAGYILNALTAWAGRSDAIRDIRVRFLGSVHAGETVVAGGEVAGIERHEGEVRVSLRLWLRNAAGTELLTGTAVVALPGAGDPE